jgi:hypothetical protein
LSNFALLKIPSILTSPALPALLYNITLVHFNNAAAAGFVAGWEGVGSTADH